MNLDEDMISVGDLIELLGVSRARAYAISRDRDFPEPAIVRPRFRAWHRDDIEKWMDRYRPGWRNR